MHASHQTIRPHGICHRKEKYTCKKSAEKRGTRGYFLTSASISAYLETSPCSLFEARGFWRMESTSLRASTSTFSTRTRTYFIGFCRTTYQ